MIPASAPIGITSNKKSMASSSGQNLLPLDGTLSKYTNVMKGWQNRYFLLNPHQGVLVYHVSQAEAFSGSHRPRGILQLAGAVISPSMDDSYTFTVNAANSEVYKLRAIDAKQRQHWVSHLRVVANHFTQQIAQEHPPITGHQAASLRKPRSISTSMSSIGNKIKDAADQVQQKTASSIAKHRPTGTGHSSNETGTISNKDAEIQPRQRSNSRNSTHKSYGTPQLTSKRHHKTDSKELSDVKEVLISADNYYAGLITMLDGLPHSPSTPIDGEDATASNPDCTLSALDEEVLLLKATAASTLNCLNDCYGMLQQYQHRKMAALPHGAQISWLQPRDSLVPSSGHPIPGMKSLSNYSGDSLLGEQTQQEPVINASDELCDVIESSESDLGTVEKHKSVIMHLLSQLKLGMDLTRVTLPTFILEKRSLLEMYADFLAHPDLFLAIPEGSSPRERMIRVVKYYLTSFHCGRKGQLAKKPYNPIVGETFQCSYYIPKSKIESDGSGDQVPRAPPTGDTHYRVRYTSEQVSHHPPVSAFYAECPDREICMNTHIWTRSKFMNMSIGVVNIGEGVITLTGHKERYVVTFPSAFARSILTTPWMELGGRCTVSCDQTNMAANIAFHTKPMYGGQAHKISAEVKDVGSGTVFCRSEGEWNGILSFTSTKTDGSQATELIDTNTYTGHKKYVRPLNLQTPTESRNMWKEVTAALSRNDINAATEHKSVLESSQRKKEKKRLDCGKQVETIMFRKAGESYIYKNPFCEL